MATRARVLVLDGHTNQALAVVRALGRAGHELLVASPWRRGLATWSRHCADRTRVAADTLEAFAALRAWAARRHVDVVLPLTERSCLLCNLAREDWTRAGIIVGCAPADTLARAFDKLATLRLAQDAGLRTPATLAPGSMEDAQAAAREIGFPCVIKPRFSHAWIDGRFLPDRGCAYAASPEDVARAVPPRRQGDLWPLVQGLVPGVGKGAFALCDRGRVLAWFAHERLRDVRPSGSGSSVRRSIALSPRLRAPAERLLAAMAWHGPAMVEFRDPATPATPGATSDGDAGEEPYLMEVNGRFWNSLQLAIEAGVDFPNLWLALLRGEPVTPPDGYAEGVTVRWLWGDVKRFLYIVSGPPRGFAGPYPSVRQGLRELLGRQRHPGRLEVWQASDPWPAIGEWVQGARELWRAGSAR